VHRAGMTQRGGGEEGCKVGLLWFFVVFRQQSWGCWGWAVVVRVFGVAVAGNKYRLGLGSRRQGFGEPGGCQWAMSMVDGAVGVAEHVREDGSAPWGCKG